MKKMTQEHISAFADAELADQEIGAVLAALRVPERREAWDVYHRIGDVLRSQDLAYEMRPEAQKRMAALLDAEPVVFAPAQAGDRAKKLPNDSAELSVAQAGSGLIRTARHFFRPGVAVAATAAAVAFFAAPPLLVAFNGWRAGDVSQMASSSSPALRTVENGDINLKAGTMTQSRTANVADMASSDVMLRDTNVDEYLFAHQRFSRSGYSNAQYASPASFTTDSAK
ncbi:sigma-E factor negative regulatory protein [Herminiimonas sp. CN]|uniref:sigma-E factor negative regulatory protein n=1 Tax=Herminiimonas sp. CN TaxID=1349818 RepID=UPI00138E2A38|nr:sigma-E factor negative regulatory protein [Herminiimonas sp. CN]